MHLPCNHSFHDRCITQYCEVMGCPLEGINCPNCRRNVETTAMESLLDPALAEAMEAVANVEMELAAEGRNLHVALDEIAGDASGAIVPSPRPKAGFPLPSTLRDLGEQTLWKGRCVSSFEKSQTC